MNEGQEEGKEGGWESSGRTTESEHSGSVEAGLLEILMWQTLELRIPNSG